MNERESVKSSFVSNDAFSEYKYHTVILQGEDVQHSMQAGLNAHLSKPVEPDVLFETLEGLLHD